MWGTASVVGMAASVVQATAKPSATITKPSPRFYFFSRSPRSSLRPPTPSQLLLTSPNRNCYNHQEWWE